VSTVATKEATMHRFLRRLLRRLSIAAVVALAVLVFAAGPAQAAEAAVDSGTWDLAHYLSTTPSPISDPSPHLPLVLGGIVVLAALSSSSGSRKRDRW
jgi:predicted anti-sigma-YlaC factor YlaD